METDDASASVKRSCWHARMIWTGLLLSNIVYFAIAVWSAGVSLRDLSLSWPDMNRGIEAAMVALASIHLLQLVWLRRSAIRWARSAAATPGGIQPGHVLARWIVRWALLTAITVCGLVVAFASHDAGKLLPFFVVSLVGLVVMFPIEAKMRQVLAGFPGRQAPDGP